MLDTTTALAVLINGDTRSAAEVVAGAIQDNDRGSLTCCTPARTNTSADSSAATIVDCHSLAGTVALMAAALLRRMSSKQHAELDRLVCLC